MDKSNENLLTEISNNQQVDAELTENTLPIIYLIGEISISEKDQHVTNIAQCESNTANSTRELHIVEHNDEDFDKQASIEQLYWEQSEIIQHKFKPKPNIQPSSINRKTVKECIIIANNRSVPRHPSYYKFDFQTTHILETLPLKMGPLTHIVGKGRNSVVIYADCLASSWIYYPRGYAVKVYKLSSDTKKNVAILKCVQKEGKHLEILRKKKFLLPCPSFVYQSRNVLVMDFVGYDQETFPTIDSISVKDFELVYQTVVQEINEWFNKYEMVHGNLCSRNLLYFDGRIFYIGWSHSVQRKHPQAFIKLMKDCMFVTNFFVERGVRVKPTEVLFREITGLDKISNKVLEVLHKNVLWNKQTNPNRINDMRLVRNSRFKNVHL